MQEPIIKNINQKPNQIELTLLFSANSQYFQGHFPEFAVLPGVAQIHFAVLFIQKYFDIIPNLKSIKKLRFMHIIQPEKEVFLVLEYKKEKQVISFKYSSIGLVHSSGDFYLSI